MKKLFICIVAFLLFLAACAGPPSPTNDPSQPINDLSQRRLFPELDTLEIKRNAKIILKELPIIKKEDALLMARWMYSLYYSKIDEMAVRDVETFYTKEFVDAFDESGIPSLIIQLAQGKNCLTFEVYNGQMRLSSADFPWGEQLEGYDMSLPPQIKNPTMKKSDPEIPTRPFPDVITPEIERNRDLILDAVQTTDDEDALKLDAVQMIDEAVALEIAKIMDTAYASELLSISVEGTTFGKFFIAAEELEKDYRIILTSQGDIQEIWTCKNDILVPLFLTNPDEQDWDE